MAMTAHKKRTALLHMKQDSLSKLLARAGLRVENGDPLVDFQPRGRDALDFTSINRTALQVLLQAAYDAGFENGARYG